MLSELQIKTLEDNLASAFEKCNFTSKDEEWLMKSMSNVAIRAIVEYDKIKSQS